MIRANRIGGSDAAAILGVDDYRSRFDVFNDKLTDEELDISNHHMDRGNFMESVIEQWVRENESPTVNSPEAFKQFDVAPSVGYQISVRHPQYPFIGGHPDGIDDEGVLWEFKAPAMRSVERMKKEGLHSRYYYQVQHYLMCTNLQVGKIAVWDYDLWRPTIHTVRANDSLHETMIREYKRFWDAVLKSREATTIEEIHLPPADNEALAQHLPVFEETELDEMFGEYMEAYRMRYDGKDKQSELKGKILTLVGDRERVVTENHTARVQYVDKGHYQYWRLTVREREQNNLPT